MNNQLIKEFTNRLTNTLEAFREDLKAVSLNASANMLKTIKAEAYREKKSLNDISTISVTDDKTITVKVWDASLAKSVEAALNGAKLGTVIAAGAVIKLALPAPSGESRNNLAKLARTHGENTKTKIRNIRRDMMDMLKQQVPSEDEQRSLGKEVEKLKDAYNDKVEEILKKKEAELIGK